MDPRAALPRAKAVLRAAAGVASPCAMPRSSPPAKRRARGSATRSFSRAHCRASRPSTPPAWPMRSSARGGPAPGGGNAPVRGAVRHARAGQDAGGPTMVAEVRQLDALARQWGMRYRVIITGHTDADGPEDCNLASAGRAQRRRRWRAAAAGTSGTGLRCRGLGSSANRSRRGPPKRTSSATAASRCGFRAARGPGAARSSNFCNGRVAVGGEGTRRVAPGAAIRVERHLEHYLRVVPPLRLPPGSQRDSR